MVRADVFAPKIDYKFSRRAKRGEPSSLQFPMWCLYCTKSEPIFKIDNVARAESVW